MFDTWIQDPSYNDLWARAVQFAFNKGMSNHRAVQFAVDYAHKYEDCPNGEIVTPATFEFHMAIEDRIYHHRTKETQTA